MISPLQTRIAIIHRKILRWFVQDADPHAVAEPWPDERKLFAGLRYAIVLSSSLWLGIFLVWRHLCR